MLAERPGVMVDWIRANKPAKLEGLWKAVLPEGSTAPPAEFAADLFWLLHQGHILLYTDDTLYVQEVREHGAGEKDAEGKPAKKKKKRSKKAKPEGEQAPAADAGPAAAEAEATVLESPVVEAPVVETETVEAPVVEAPVVNGPIVEAPTVESPVSESPEVEATEWKLRKWNSEPPDRASESRPRWQASPSHPSRHQRSRRRRKFPRIQRPGLTMLPAYD